MKIILFAAVGILVLLLLVSIMKLSVIIDLQHAQDNDRIKITFKVLFGLIRYTVLIPLVKIDKDSPGIIVSYQEKIGSGRKNSTIPQKKEKYTPSEIMDWLKKTREFVAHVVRLNEIIKKFMSHISITKFEWHTNLGTGDAAYTGMAVGIGWSIKYGVVGLLSNYMKLKTMPVLTITPFFQQPTSQIKLICMIHFRIGHAMLAGMRIVKYWRGNHLSEQKSFAADKANESY